MAQSPYNTSAVWCNRQGQKVAESLWFQEILKTDAIYFSDLFPDQETGEAIIVMGKRIDNGKGEPAMVLAVEMPETFPSVYDGLHRGHGRLHPADDA